MCVALRCLAFLSQLSVPGVLWRSAQLPSLFTHFAFFGGKAITRHGANRAIDRSTPGFRSRYYLKHRRSSELVS